MLESEDEYLEELFPPATSNELAEVRQLFAQLHGSRPTSRQSRPLRQDSTATLSAVPHRLHQPYSADSDADDEGAADELVSRFRDQLGLEDAHSRSTSSNSSRDASVEASRFPHHRDDAGDEEGSASDSSQSIRGTTRPTTAESKGATHDIDEEAEAAGQRTPPSQPTRLSGDGGSDVNRYRVLFDSLETPRALPVLTPTSEDEPLPPAFAKLQSISPNMARIQEKPEDESEGKHTPIGGVPKLDLEGWRASKDDKPETWCSECIFHSGDRDLWRHFRCDYDLRYLISIVTAGICNADATVKCGGCDNDLYCKQCFNEGHKADAFDAAEHKPVDIES